MTVRWQGFAVGFLSLTLLEVAVANPGASGRLGGLATGAGNLAQRFLSPTMPLIGTPPASTPAPAGPPAASSSSTPSTSTAPVMLPQQPGTGPINFNLPLLPGTSAA